MLVAAPLLAAAVTLPRCTIAVAGANGRVGSMVCRELLRNHPLVTVRALVRSASDPYQGYGRLSYEVGAEDGKMDLRPAWQRDDETGRFAAPATIEFDEAVQSNYGLERLELRECELRYKRDVEDALADADGVIFCASAFNSFRQRLPDRVDEAASQIADRGMAFFELRLGDALFGKPQKEDGTDPARTAEAQGKTADVEGLQHACITLSQQRQRRASIAQISGREASAANKLRLPLVLASASDCLGYDENPLSLALQENEFGYRKRMGVDVVRTSGLPHASVQSASIDDVRTEEGLELKLEAEVDRVAAAATAGGAATAEEADGAVGVRRDEAKRRRIHPRDLAAFLVASLAAANDESAGEASSGTIEVWTAMAGE